MVSPWLTKRDTLAARVTTYYYDIDKVDPDWETHNKRQRLISEVRLPDQQTSVYAFTYEYDELGNRLRKYDGV